VREPNLERAHRMMARIRSDLDVNPDAGPWVAAARTLSERLIISEDSFYFLAEMFMECLLFSASRADLELSRIRDEMDEIERAHGLREDEFWRIDEGPDDWRGLNDAWNARAEEIVVSSLRRLGHADVAALREQHPAEFERRTEKGRTDLWGADDEPQY
jgi:hypothetical protein